MENKQKVYERDYISKEIMEKERANVNSLKRAITYVAQASALNTVSGKSDIHIYKITRLSYLTNSRNYLIFLYLSLSISRQVYYLIHLFQTGNLSSFLIKEQVNFVN